MYKMKKRKLEIKLEKKKRSKNKKNLWNTIKDENCINDKMWDCIREA